jgi:hypothetical protein
MPVENKGYGALFRRALCERIYFNVTVLQKQLSV